MKCRETQQMIYRYLNNDLDEKELQAFLDHVRECPSCYEELEIYYSVQEAIEYLEDNGRGAMNPAQLLKLELDEKRKGLRRYRLFRTMQSVLIGLAFAVIVIAGVLEVREVADTVYKAFEAQDETLENDQTNDRTDRN